MKKEEEGDLKPQVSEKKSRAEPSVESGTVIIYWSMILLSLFQACPSLLSNANRAWKSPSKGLTVRDALW